jgi:zinc/manganese transport system substrate-binding protein/manganese/iron transport system substrate-binding protein
VAGSSSIISVKLAWLVVGLLLALILAACGDSTNTAQPAASLTTARAATASTGATNTASSTAAAAANTPAANPTAPAVKINVLATTTQLGDFARNLGGNRVQVVQILRPDDDPHDYNPTAADSKNAAAAQVIFKNGIGVDDWMDKIITNSGTKAPLINVSDGITLRAGEGAEEKLGDPHIWHSTDNAKIMVATMAKALIGADPAGKDYYQGQLTAYQNQLDNLKNRINQIFAPIPVEKRQLVTNHDAFGYFTDEFQITVVGSVIPSFSDAAQPTPQEINRLIKNIKSNNVKVIFTETTINPKVAEQVAQAAGVKIYSNLYGDALGAPGSDGDTYLKMELSNAQNMAAGFKQ